MRALICRAWGPIDTLTVEEIAPPAPAADEVLIDVRATSVNYADSIMVAGKYQTRPPFPFSPGLETAGVVARCGAGATRFKPGDRVMPLTGDRGADVCFDPVGGELADAALSSLGWGGRMLLVGFVGGVQQIPANRLLVKNRSALGCSLRHYRFNAPDKLRSSVQALIGWYAAGKLKPHVSHRLPLDRAVEAIRLLTDRRALGKVVVTLGS